VISGSVFWVNRRFENYRLFGRRLVEGWLEPRVLPILAVLDSAQLARNISGAVAEIGVHHGKLFIGLNLLRQKDEYSVAIDVFGSQQLNIDRSGKGDLASFRRNVQRWSSLSRVVIHDGDPRSFKLTSFAKLRARIFGYLALMEAIRSQRYSAT
jgi:hypothetical protein